MTKKMETPTKAAPQAVVSTGVKGRRIWSICNNSFLCIFHNFITNEMYIYGWWQRSVIHEKKRVLTWSDNTSIQRMSSIHWVVCVQGMLFLFTLCTRFQLDRLFSPQHCLWISKSPLSFGIGCRKEFCNWKYSVKFVPFFQFFEPFCLFSVWYRMNTRRLLHGFWTKFLIN